MGAQSTFLAYPGSAVDLARRVGSLMKDDSERLDFFIRFANEHLVFLTPMDDGDFEEMAVMPRFQHWFEAPSVRELTEPRCAELAKELTRLDDNILERWEQPALSGLFWNKLVAPGDPVVDVLTPAFASHRHATVFDPHFCRPNNIISDIKNRAKALTSFASACLKGSVRNVVVHTMMNWNRNSPEEATKDRLAGINACFEETRCELSEAGGIPPDRKLVVTINLYTSDDIRGFHDRTISFSCSSAPLGPEAKADEEPVAPPWTSAFAIGKGIESFWTGAGRVIVARIRASDAGTVMSARTVVNPMNHRFELQAS